ncbi:helix-turn-helix transcriptional regulator [Actinoplanes missouriensis]|uniref:helix-turn-helix transcriptional regulator n=1 Tax=Actinoplanes missouriensis TaxID=1866 RepID=UPI0033FCC55E
MTFEHRKALGDFLRAMRARTKPEEVGLPSRTGRRVPGLRRAEVAELTGISTDYYIRMESGRAGEVSAHVLGALTAALRLSPPEAAYLRTLATSPGVPAGTGAIPLDMDLPLLLDTIQVPAYATNRRLDVLAANLPLRLLITEPGTALGAPGNLVAWHFLDRYSRRLIADWPASAATVTAALRMQVARYPDDTELIGFITRLCAASPEFTVMWDAPQVPDVWRGRQTARHPEAGDYEFTFVSLSIAGVDDVMLTTFVPVPGTGSETVMHKLLRQPV